MAHLEDDLWKPKPVRLFRLNNGRSFERVSIQSSEAMINAIHMGHKVYACMLSHMELFVKSN